MDEIDKLLCDTDGEAVYQAIEAACGDLVERFGLDSIHIIATKSERMSPRKTEGGTRVIQAGAGNYYARYGSLREWVAKEEAAQKQGFSDRERDEE